MTNLFLNSWISIIAYLDAMSAFVRRWTYNFENLLVAGSNSSYEPRRLHVLLEIVLVSISITAIAFFSRITQYEIMASEVTSYFLEGMVNVSTTHDAGHFMLQAREWYEGLLTSKNFFDVNAAQLPPYLIAKIALVMGCNLEEAARTLVYLSVSATGISGYLIFLALGQSLLGLVVGHALVFFFPVYSRTSLGMVDTDQLNLFFMLIVTAALVAAARSNKPKATLLYACVAALLFQLFNLWYPRTGFLLAFASAFFGMLLVYRVRVKISIAALVLFLGLSGPQQFSGLWTSLSAFWGLYVQRPVEAAASVAAGTASGVDLEATIFPTIGEISTISVDLIRNDYGSLAAFTIALVGLVVWLLQDWRRIMAAAPFLPFLALYAISGQRFSFYAAPLLLTGLVVSAGTIGAAVWRPVLTRLDNKLSQPAPFQKQATAPLSLGSDKKYPAIVRRSCLATLILSLGWPMNVLTPPGIVPPPVINAEEMNLLRKALWNVPNDRALIASWWDYGYEIAYQTGKKTVTDGGNPANIKNIYLARAFISPNPHFAADEIRFATYFDTGTLSRFHPRRPGLEHAIDTDKDIYLFLPSDLQHKMIAVFNIAATTIAKEALVGYDAQMSTFFILYHRQPESWGPFIRVSTEKDGGVLYRLPAPNRP